SPSRRARLSPALAILIGVISMPAGYALKGAVGGALVGLGIAAVVMGIWGLAASWFGPKPLRMVIRPRQKSLSDQAKFFQSHPPRCIAGFAAVPTQLPTAKSDGHASKSDLKNSTSVPIDAPEHINPVFALFCSCGGNRHFVHGYRWSNPDSNYKEVFLSPIVMECAACGKK